MASTRRGVASTVGLFLVFSRRVSSVGVRGSRAGCTLGSSLSQCPPLETPEVEVSVLAVVAWVRGPGVAGEPSPLGWLPAVALSLLTPLLPLCSRPFLTRLLSLSLCQMLRSVLQTQMPVLVFPPGGLQPLLPSTWNPGQLLRPHLTPRPVTCVLSAELGPALTG